MGIEFIEDNGRYAIAQASFGKIYFGKIYRFMKMDGIKATIQTGKIRYISSHLLNDPLDCNPRLFNFEECRFDKLPFNSQKELVLKHLMPQFASRLFKNDNIRLDFLNHVLKSLEKELPEEIQSLPISDVINSFSKLLQKKINESGETLEQFYNEFNTNNNVKVCCFSREYKNKNSTLMWSHYADSHAGACIEFDFSSFINDNIDKDIKHLKRIFTKFHFLPLIVDYVKSLPKFDFYSDDDDEKYKWTCTKEQYWKYEKEIRLVLLSYNSNSFEDIKFPKSLLSKIIFGSKTSNEEINEVIKIIKELYGNHKISFEQIYFSSGDHKLKSKKIVL